MAQSPIDVTSSITDEPSSISTPSHTRVSRSQTLRRSGSKYGKLGLNLNISIDNSDNLPSNGNNNGNNNHSNRSSFDFNNQSQINTQSQSQPQYQTQNQSQSQSQSQSGTPCHKNFPQNQLQSQSQQQTPRRSFSLNHHHRSDSSSATSNIEPNHTFNEIKTPTPSTPLPTIDKLEKLDINVQLRLLAMKEMSVVELKDTIKNFNIKLQKEEKELHKLREIIQKSLYKELRSNDSLVKNDSNSNANPNSQINNNQIENQIQNSYNPRDAAIASTKNRRRTLSSSQSLSTPINSPSNNNSTSSKRNSIWGNLSKPLNLIQQFDTMLQTEFEKSLLANGHNNNNTHNNTNSEGTSLKPINHRTSSSQGSSNSFASIDSITSQSTSSPLKQKQKNVSQPIIELAENKEDMLQTVSSHLWSFMSDVKHNLLSNDEIRHNSEIIKPLLEDDETNNNNSNNNLRIMNTRKKSDENIELMNFEIGDVSMNQIDLTQEFDDYNDFEVDLNFYNKLRKKDEQDRLPKTRIGK